MNLSQLAESDARREEDQNRERHNAALIAAIVCRIWRDRTRIGPSVRQRPPRFSDITETEAWRNFRFRAEERKLHGCTLFDFLVEVRGNDRGTSVDFRGCCHGLPWKSAGFHGKCHGSWRFHGQCHGCGHSTCRDSVRGKLRGNNHCNPLLVNSGLLEKNMCCIIETLVRRDWSGKWSEHGRRARVIYNLETLETKEPKTGF